MSTVEGHHLDEAVARLSNRWIPINNNLLEKLRDDIKNPATPTTAILDGLKQDFSLFLYALRTLQDLIGDPEQVLDPGELFQRVHREQLEAVLNTPAHEISPYVLTDAAPQQIAKAQETLVSANVAESLAASYNVSPENAYTAAAFRQLGLTLIAWNYPKVYERLSHSCTDYKRFDLMLTRILGFSPMMLGAKLAAEWNLAPEIRWVVGDPHASEHSAPEVMFLSKLCEIGETFAQLAEPVKYPDAKGDWESAKQEILSVVGESGLKSLTNRIVRQTSSYKDILPQFFEYYPNLTENMAVARKEVNVLRSRNRYLQRCPASLQQQLHQLYENIDGKNISKANIDQLVSTILPESGFSRGCIYLIEPTTMALVPRLSVGDVKPSDYRVVAVNGNIAERFDPILSAFRCKTPIMEQNVVIDGKPTTYIASVLGTDQKAGVLYLELTEQLANQNEAEPLFVFRAIAQALADSLGLD